MPQGGAPVMCSSGVAVPSVWLVCQSSWYTRSLCAVSGRCTLALNACSRRPLRSWRCKKRYGSDLSAPMNLDVQGTEEMGALTAANLMSITTCAGAATKPQKALRCMLHEGRSGCGHGWHLEACCGVQSSGAQEGVFRLEGAAPQAVAAGSTARRVAAHRQQHLSSRPATFANICRKAREKTP